MAARGAAFRRKSKKKTDFDGRPIAFDLTGGEKADTAHFETLMNLGPDIVPCAVVADKGCDSRANRALARKRGMVPVIPYRSNTKHAPKVFAKALYRGRTPSFGFRLRPPAPPPNHPVLSGGWAGEQAGTENSMDSRERAWTRNFFMNVRWLGDVAEAAFLEVFRKNRSGNSLRGRRPARRPGWWG